MNVVQALKSRNSTRAYMAEPVAKEMVMQILDAANKAPSWANTQPWDIFVATGEPLERLRKRNLENFQNGVPPKPDRAFPPEWPEAHKNRTATMAASHLKLHGIERDDPEGRRHMTERNMVFFGAPAMIYLCMDHALSHWSMYDLGAMSQSIMLAAQHYGLNTIPAIMMAVYPEFVREELQVPDHLDIVIGIALGYADPDSLANKHITTRRPLDEFVTLSGF